MYVIKILQLTLESHISHSFEYNYLINNIEKIYKLTRSVFSFFFETTQTHTLVGIEPQTSHIILKSLYT